MAVPRDAEREACSATLHVPDPFGGAMSDEDDQTTVDADDPQLAGAAARSALKKLRKDLVAAEKRAAEAEAREALAAAERTQNEKDEITRLRESVDRLSAERDLERDARERDRLDRERVERVRRHASDFADADDVVAMLRGKGELEAIEDDDDAKRVVAELKRDKPHLLRRDEIPSGLEQVLKNGEMQKKENGDKKPDPGVLSWDELHQLTDEQLLQMKQTDPERYWKSVNGPVGGPLRAVRTPHHMIT